MNVATGALAGATVPFVYLTGFVIGIRAGWVTDDPTVTRDGSSIPVGMGVLAIIVTVVVFAVGNVALARWGTSLARWDGAGPPLDAGGGGRERARRLAVSSPLL